MKITAEIKERTPLIQPEWTHMMVKIAESRFAPRWNTQCGDRLTQKDLPFIHEFEEALHFRSSRNEISDRLIEWINGMRTTSWWFEAKLKGLQVEKDFHRIPCMTRSDLQVNLEQIVPHSIDLDRLVVNPTSGTTGQPILCPNHPSAIGCYDPMIQFMLQRHGINETHDHKKMAAIQLCAQQNTMTYFTVHSLLKGAGFAKINLMANPDWPDMDSPGSFIKELEPVFLSGDPISFLYGLKMGLDYQPKALISTAVTLEPALRLKLQLNFGCPVINFYSLNETGPLAYSCPLYPDSFHILPHDIHIETVDEKGLPTPDGNPGEIIVTGGRNPYLPLLRYKTGDFGALDRTPCSCGDPHSRIIGLSARKPVVFFDGHQRMVNPIDISRILRSYPVSSHQMVQKMDTHCKLELAFDYHPGNSVLASIRKEILALFRNSIALDLVIAKEGFGKTDPYICEINMLGENQE